MKLSDMKTVDEVIQEHRQDPEFRAEWDRSAFARAVATRVVAYRTKKGMTQRDLARATGLTQPAIARLEGGEREPSLSTLAKLTTATGLAFHVAVARGAVGLAKSGRATARKAFTPAPSKGVKLGDVKRRSTSGRRVAKQSGKSVPAGDRAVRAAS